MSAETKADRMPLGGLVKRQVIRDIALGTMSQSQLGEKYGVSQPAISQFAKRNAEEIEAVRAKADDEFAGLLIAQKQNRLAAYQDLYEIALKPQPKISPSGKLVKEWITDEDGNQVEVIVQEVDVRAAAQMLKQAAEELGQLPNRLTLAGEVGVKTNYVIDGIDPGALK
jgi:transcriptional regulator with XRE-family HTH domain